MASVQLYQYAVVDLGDGRTVKAGSLSEARSVSIGDGVVIDRIFSVDPDTGVKVFDAAEDEALGDFSFMWLESDLDVLVQFTADADVNDDYDVKTLKGSGTSGKMGPALVLGSNVTQLLDGTIDLFDGSAGTVDQVWVFNDSATSTAHIRMVAAT